VFGESHKCHSILYLRLVARSFKFHGTIEEV
jgi:hypothetical protein